MSRTKSKKSKTIPVLKRKPVRAPKVPEHQFDQNTFINSAEFQSVLSESIRESLNKAIPSIVEEVIKDLEKNQTK